ncbi:ADP-ribosyl cyclase/cyclic ADP-ribose hydrolase 1-like [Solea senegalensis]|uniref:ADP-ribosyl cyclase/cyclic ADP-ribose hydrolase n=1 Tax=Solea senegalensis TaxID=28829 RepID=A0AAV6T905_SOLSE|nr:ADP-ribosyl cyclase/cyclic ADP-ribose hydrolase 1-like [Solea senegalensis]KAG7525648.1 ADP-ribosyl cyclase/cyclic ADP-ribose hydrolase 1-like [Solea senegalensis]
MERDYRPAHRGRRRLIVFLGVCAIILLVIIVAVLLVVVIKDNETNQLEKSFLTRCEAFEGYNCEEIWIIFKNAFVQKDPCKVPMEAYDLLFTAVPTKPSCNRMMFWTKTKDFVHDFTGKKDCFVTLENMMLGSVLDGLTWCGKENSDEIFTSGCPGWTDCENNAVRSFWNKASTEFADAACGDVSAMLNGSIATPYAPTSIFASIEVKRFTSPRVRSLTVVLVTEEKDVTNCTNASLKNLQNDLDKGIKYSCKEVAESQLQECSNNPEKPCGTCW